ncbi:MAG TPA: ATP-binding protein [Candidatus Angelobacter sp.]|jgi:signal transduction histidine kinase
MKSNISPNDKIAILKPGRVETRPVTAVASLETIWRKLSDGIVISDAQGRITLINSAAQQMAQMEAQGMLLEFAAQIWGRLFDLGGHEIAPQNWPTMRAARGHTTVQQECRLVQGQGEYHDILFSAAPLCIAGGKAAGVIATLTDITELSRRSLLLRQQAVSRERNRMAEDLHDVFCQKLNAILLQLEAAQCCATGDDEYTGRVRTATDIARGCLTEARSCLWTFCHESLGGVDPASKLSEVAKKMVRGTPICLDLSLQQQPRALPPKLPLELLRIGQEALSNVVKHSGATRVNIELAYKRQAVHFSVQDDGRGFIRRSVDLRKKGFGLISMKERTERLGGKMSVDSRPGGGTRVAAVIPLPFAIAA